MINGFLDKKQAELYFAEPVGEICTWIEECNDKAIGRGMFTSPDNRYWGVHDLCERHANRQIESEDTVTVPRPWGYE